MIFAKLFVLGVSLGVALSDQSAAALQEDETDAGVQEKGRIDTPAVVLQLKYAKGELNRIYLAQFRKGNAAWTPSVAVRSDLCSDLCHAGLGGEACGPTCEDLMPVGLQSALANSSDDRPSQDTRMMATEIYGEPRVDVCPALCGNKLGQPLCNCADTLDKMADVNWGAVCTSFCGDNYVLRGCPTCEGAPSQIAKFSSRTLSTAEGWALWCNAQCRQGHGGAACNCDRSPL